MKFYKSAYIMCLLLLMVISLASDSRLYVIEPLDLSGSSVCGNVDCSNIGSGLTVGNVDCSIYCNIINGPTYAINSPTANVSSLYGLTDASYNSLIKYNSNNFMLSYHEDISLNPQLAGLVGLPIYDAEAKPVSNSDRVPGYVDSVLLSQASFRDH